MKDIEECRQDIVLPNCKPDTADMTQDTLSLTLLQYYYQSYQCRSPHYNYSNTPRFERYRANFSMPSSIKVLKKYTFET